MLLFLVASGLTLVLGVRNVLNIPHVAFYMPGAYFSYQMLHWVENFWIGLVVCPIAIAWP
jgi:branched-chain amino acid transport system permease protein